ncbi:MAG: VIT1/CCC1 transporter family protein [Candidatus Nanohaloarchaea archaeon]|nr:VIT1/CCC1 transporter family protein [Candidatus Nanohaloarchaea archaeon]
MSLLQHLGTKVGIIRNRIDGLREAWNRDEVRSISRRYLISNGFDGTLTSIGMTVGSFLSGVESGMIVVTVGIGATIGLATSGVWSVWEIEKSEKLSDLHDLENKMLRDLTDTELTEQMQNARLINAVASGTGPVFGIMLPVLPFALAGIYYSLLTATLLSILIGMGVLFIMGSYMGRISRRTWYIAGLRMAIAGLVVAGVNYLLPG